jgi:hypothetical protein
VGGEVGGAVPASSCAKVPEEEEAVRVGDGAWIFYTTLGGLVPKRYP